MIDHEPQPSYATEFSGLLTQLQSEGGTREIAHGWTLEVRSDGITFHHPPEFAEELAGRSRYFLANGKLYGIGSRPDARPHEVDGVEAAALVGSLRSLAAAGPDRRNVLH